MDPPTLSTVPVFVWRFVGLCLVAVALMFAGTGLISA